MSSKNQPEWISLANVGQAGLVNDSIQNTLKTLQKANNSVLKTLNTAEKVAKIALPLLSLSTDAVALLVKSSATIFRRALGEIAAYGGHMILIHPYNRASPRQINIGGTSPIELKVPALSPRESFQELEASFSNTSDAARPRWKESSPVTGFGLLLTAPNLTGLAELMDLMSQFIALKEFVEVTDRLNKDLLQFKKDVKLQGLLDAWKDTAQDPSLPTSTSFKTIKQTKVDKKTKTVYAELVKKTLDLTVKAPKLHWVGLNLYSFPYIKEFIDYLDGLAESLSRLADSTDSAIQDTIQIIFKKIRNLSELLNKANSILLRISQTIEATGIYLILIPPKSGGIPYIMDSLQSAFDTTSDPDVRVLQNSIDSINASALFFAGLSAPTIKSLQTWFDLFSSAWDSTEATIATAIDDAYNELIELSNVKLKDGRPVSDGDIIPSSESTVEISVTPPADQDPDDPLTYSTLAETDTETLSKFTSTSTNPATAGKTTLTIPTAGSGGINGTGIGGGAGSVDVSFLYSADGVSFKIYLSELLAGPLPAIIYENPWTVTVIPSMIGTIAVYEVFSSGTETLLEKQFVYKPDDPIILGSTISAGYHICKLVLYDQVQDKTETFTVILDTRYLIITIGDSVFDAITDSFTAYVPSYPIYVKYLSEKYSSMAYGSPYKYTKIPSYQLINQDTDFDYIVYSNKKWREQSKHLYIIEKDVGFLDIC